MDDGTSSASAHDVDTLSQSPYFLSTPSGNAQQLATALYQITIPCLFIFNIYHTTLYTVG